jgi:UDP-N-acetylglucosamine:LPS N-acetylglucosamine transferase
MIRLGHEKMVDRLAQHWEQTRPDLVVSLVPNFNRALGASLQALPTRTPFVTVMTDLADLPPHFWVEPGFTEHLICGTGHAVEQALSQGIPAQRVHRVQGMMLAPDFHRPAVDDRAARRRQLGLDPQAPVGIVMFGGHGARAMLRIAEELDHLPLILLCGHNESLRRSLAAQRASAPRHVLGFTDGVVQWMRLADYFIGKPGPGSISEALHCGLPVVVTRNAWTMPQERWNTEWIRQTQVGVVLSAFSQVRAGVEAILTDLPRWRARAAQIDNRALSEVPGILQQVLAEGLLLQAPTS